MITGTERLAFWGLAAAFILMAGAAEASSLTVGWDPSADPVVVGYRVSFGSRSGVYTADIDTGTQTIQQVPNLTPGTAYYFVVRAYDAVGNMSGPSQEVMGVAPLSSALSVTCPAALAVSPTGTSVAVTFNAITSGGAAPVTTTCTPASGSRFAVGATPVQCTAKDAAGITARCTGSVVVSTTSSVSVEGTHVPPASQIVDETGATYTLKNASPYPMIMRNGVQLAGGFGTALAWCRGEILRARRRQRMVALDNGRILRTAGSRQGRPTPARLRSRSRRQRPSRRTGRTSRRPGRSSILPATPTRCRLPVRLRWC